MKKDAKELKMLYAQYIKAKGKYDTSIAKIHSELERISGIELFVDDMPGDGLGVSTDGDTHMLVFELIHIIEQKGTFTDDDVFQSF